MLRREGTETTFDWWTRERQYDPGPLGQDYLTLTVTVSGVGQTPLNFDYTEKGGKEGDGVVGVSDVQGVLQ